jgi:acyl transferase domain-containing protein
MGSNESRAVAIVGLGAVLPDALSVGQFWDNLIQRRYSITEVPPDRWSIAHYYNPDPAAPDKTYSKIGGWVQGFDFNWKNFHIPPRVSASMDPSQKWALDITAQALEDYGFPSGRWTWSGPPP